MAQITIADLADSFGVDETEIDDITRNDLLSHDFTFYMLSDTEKDAAVRLLSIEVEKDNQVVGTETRKDVWQNGWAENLKDFNKNKDDLSAITPKFIQSREYLRFKNQVIRPHDPDFHKNYLCLFHRWLFRKYLPGIDNVYEFGCGTGYNLLNVVDLFPHIKVVASDVIESAVELVNSFSQHHNFNIEAQLFNMLYPDYDLQIEKNSFVIAMGCIEQLAGHFQPFLDYLLHYKPQLCLIMEAMPEFYDENDPIDRLSIQLHRKRKYTSGLLTYLRKLDKIEIVKQKRLHMGDVLHTAYNYVIWKMK